MKDDAGSLAGEDRQAVEGNGGEEEHSPGGFCAAIFRHDSIGSEKRKWCILNGEKEVGAIRGR